MTHAVNCPRSQVWDGGEWDIPCTCDPEAFTLRDAIKEVFASHVDIARSDESALNMLRELDHAMAELAVRYYESRKINQSGDSGLPNV